MQRAWSWLSVFGLAGLALGCGEDLVAEEACNCLGGAAPTTTTSAVATGVGGSGGMDGTGGAGAAGGSGGMGGSGGEAWTGVPFDRPLRLAFVGNSFTFQGPVPHLVRDVAASVGWPTPEVELVAVGGQSLTFHRNHSATLAMVDAGSWDFVVLQDFSTRPTDDAGDPAAFKDDGAWFYDRVKAASPDAGVVLYETWARHPDHPIYPGTFPDPASMQAQLRFHYNDAADNYVPQNATFTPSTDVVVAPVGDTWEAHLGGSDPLRLHGTDDYHAGSRGQYLNALVLYSTIYGVVATGAGSLSLDPAEAAQLQADADATTGIATLPPAFPVPELNVGQTVQVDFGTVATGGTTWNEVTDCASGVRFDAVDDTGASTGVDVSIVNAFTGSNELGLAANTLGYPGTVSSDVCWVGSFDDHATALLETATIAIDDLAPGTYDLVVFASRTGDDGGAGRLTRYAVGAQSQDLEASDNTSTAVQLTGLSPDANGRITLDVTVSPAGMARFGYLGALLLTKTAD